MAGSSAKLNATHGIKSPSASSAIMFSSLILAFIFAWSPLHQPTVATCSELLCTCWKALMIDDAKYDTVEPHQWLAGVQAWLGGWTI